MARVVEQYYTCQLENKRKQNARLYTPLLVPYALWQDISIDFVLGLSRTPKQHDSIFMVMKYFSKMVNFLPCSKDSDASRIVRLIFDEVVQLHGVPKTIVFD